MGAVYLATDLPLKRAVAVKTLTCASVPHLMRLKAEA